MHDVPAGAGLTAAYTAEVESEAVTSDASVLQMNVTGGLPGSGVDGTLQYKVQATHISHCIQLMPQIFVRTRARLGLPGG